MENVVLVNFKLGDFESYDYQGYLDSKYGVEYVKEEKNLIKVMI